MSRNRCPRDVGDCLGFTIWAMCDPVDGWHVSYQAWIMSDDEAGAVNISHKSERLSTLDALEDVKQIAVSLLEEMPEPEPDPWTQLTFGNAWYEDHTGS